MRYFNGELESFSDIPLSPKGTAFQQAIWAALRQILMEKQRVMVD